MPTKSHPLCLLHKNPTKPLLFWQQFCHRTPLFATILPPCDTLLNATTLISIIMPILRITANLRSQKPLHVIVSKLAYLNFLSLNIHRKSTVVFIYLRVSVNLVYKLQGKPGTTTVKHDFNPNGLKFHRGSPWVSILSWLNLRQIKATFSMNMRCNVFCYYNQVWSIWIFCFVTLSHMLGQYH